VTKMTAPRHGRTRAEPLTGQATGVTLSALHPAQTAPGRCDGIFS
jgi:hypothetical protein